MKSQEALALLRKHGASEGVIGHVKKVRDYALEIAREAGADLELVEAGALLHDIGRSKTHGIDHAVVGAEILRREGVDPRIVRIVERHVGAGITKEEARWLGLPPKDYIPQTLEEKIVCHADNLTGDRRRINIHEALDKALKKWSPGAADRLVQMHFDVFRPQEAELLRCDKEAVERSIGKLDVLYKIYPRGEGCRVAAYGHDAKKAAARLRSLKA